MLTKKKFTNDYANKAQKYSEQKEIGTLKVAYKAFPGILSKHQPNGNLAIDIGSGTGRSRRYLEDIGFDALGVDIDPAMIEKAKLEDFSNASKYYLMNNDVIPFRDAAFDLAFSSLVVLEIENKEAYRVMKFEGLLYILTVTDEFYKRRWVSVDTNFPENKQPRSGDKLRVRIKEIDLELFDYYWQRSDYLDAATEASLTLIDEYFPLADANTESWLDEEIYPPFGIYIFRKSESLKKISDVEKKYGLTISIPNKGSFVETARDTTIVELVRKKKDKVLREKYSAIRLLISVKDKINFHAVNSDEKLIYVEGSDIIVHMIDKDGNYYINYLGKEHEQSILSITIPAGTIFCEEVAGKYSYAIMDIENKPAFHPDDCTEFSEKEVVSKINPSSLDLFRKKYLKESISEPNLDEITSMTHSS